MCLNACTSLGFKKKDSPTRPGRQRGMLRQQTGPLRHIEEKKKKVELFTFLLHAQTKPWMSQALAVALTDWAVHMCVCGPVSFCISPYLLASLMWQKFFVIIT